MSQQKQERQQKHISKDQLQAENLIDKIDDGDDEYNCFSVYYKVDKILGYGSFGVVAKAFHLEQKINVAIKVIHKDKAGKQNCDTILQEASILNKAKHKNIVKFIELKQTYKRIFIVMELVEGGTLKSLMHQKIKDDDWFTEEEASIIMKQVFQAVEYIHNLNIIHRDIKPENILIGKDIKDIKIADFGLSVEYDKRHEDHFFRDWCGTLTYMAPEFFKNEIYSKPIDVWSCAIIMYRLIAKGTHPFYDPKVDTNETYKIKVNQTNWNIPQYFSKLAKNLFLKCVQNNPMERYTISQCLNHPWITRKKKDSIPMSCNDIYKSAEMSQKLASYIKMQYFLQIIKKKIYESQSPTSKKMSQKLFASQKKQQKKYKKKCLRVSQAQKEGNLDEKLENQEFDVISSDEEEEQDEYQNQNSNQSIDISQDKQNENQDSQNSIQSNQSIQKAEIQVNDIIKSPLKKKNIIKENINMVKQKKSLSFQQNASQEQQNNDSPIKKQIKNHNYQSISRKSSKENISYSNFENLSQKNSSSNLDQKKTTPRIVINAQQLKQKNEISHNQSQQQLGQQQSQQTDRSQQNQSYYQQYQYNNQNNQRNNKINSLTINYQQNGQFQQQIQNKQQSIYKYKKSTSGSNHSLKQQNSESTSNAYTSGDNTPGLQNITIMQRKDLVDKIQIKKSQNDKESYSPLKRDSLNSQNYQQSYKSKTMASPIKQSGRPRNSQLNIQQQKLTQSPRKLINGQRINSSQQQINQQNSINNQTYNENISPVKQNSSQNFSQQSPVKQNQQIQKQPLLIQSKKFGDNHILIKNRQYTPQIERNKQLLNMPQNDNNLNTSISNNINNNNQNYNKIPQKNNAVRSRKRGLTDHIQNNINQQENQNQFQKNLKQQQSVQNYNKPPIQQTNNNTKRFSQDKTQHKSQQKVGSQLNTINKTITQKFYKQASSKMHSQTIYNNTNKNQKSKQFPNISQKQTMNQTDYGEFPKQNLIKKKY